MPEIERMVFSFSEIAEALIRKNDIHEGLWGIYVEFGLSAANIATAPDQWNPAAVIPVMKIGLQKFDKPNSLTANAAEVNPLNRLQPRDAKK